MMALGSVRCDVPCEPHKMLPGEAKANRHWVRRGLSNNRTRLRGPIFGQILASLLPGVGPNLGFRRPPKAGPAGAVILSHPRRQGGQNRYKDGPPEPCTTVTKAPADPSCNRVLLGLHDVSIGLK